MKNENKTAGPSLPLNQPDCPTCGHSNVARGSNVGSWWCNDCDAGFTAPAAPAPADDGSLLLATQRAAIECAEERASLLEALRFDLTFLESAAMLNREAFDTCAWETLRDAAKLRADQARAVIAQAESSTPGSRSLVTHLHDQGL